MSTTRVAILGIYRRLLRLSVLFPDPQAQLYLTLRVQERFRAHADLTSQPRIVACMRAARQECRRLGRAIGGCDRRQFHRILELSYGIRGHLKYLLSPNTSRTPSTPPFPSSQSLRSSQSLIVDASEHPASYCALVSRGRATSTSSAASATAASHLVLRALQTRLAEYPRWRRRMYKNISAQTRKPLAQIDFAHTDHQSHPQ
ncbi:mitochondrial Complex1_LYR family protein [Andalucia godoyi]|uniref:Mitochondrial Complex1_LYR family protein n=1 Tax=Andalucia godoyi TaxID=505711 RepID=A0A8K0F4J6_ANDGO|nr:mitochondrial Complex1_LYR family protein [Andalucia godoyi]|eukprot:ANDGO_01019.mRNA.1 mitochondrial Complex1_LYR family protein